MAVRDLRVYAEALSGKLYHYRDNTGLECDAVLHRRNGTYGLIEIKLGGEKKIEEGVKSLMGVPPTRIDEIKGAREANLDHIRDVIARYDVPEDTPVLLCFGNAYSKVIKDETISSCLSDILDLIPSGNLKCLGFIKTGCPKHPLYAGTYNLIDYPVAKQAPQQR